MSGASGLRKHGHTTDGDGGTIASGGGGGFVDNTTSVSLDTGRLSILDDTGAASIYLHSGRIDLTSSGDDIGIYAASGQVVDMQSGNGLALPSRSSDPTAFADGHLFYRSDIDKLRLRASGAWVTGETVAAKGFATVPSGSTVVTVTPSLGYDPGDAGPILITPINNPTNDPGWFWVDNVGFDTFDLHVRSNPGAGGAQFAYRILS